MKLRTGKIAGQSIDIDIDQLGQFSATFNENEYTAKTQAELVEQLTSAVKKAASENPVDVTVIGVIARDHRSYSSTPYQAGVGFVHAKLKARHQRHDGVWLLRAEYGGQKFQVGSYSGEGTIVRRLTVEESVEYMRLATLVVDAQKALDAFEADVKINPQEELDAKRDGEK